MKNILVKLFFVFIFMTNANYIVSQLKVYEGVYANGFAKYTYLQNEDMTRTFEGDFMFVSSENKEWYLKGKFKNNLKDGKWISTLSGINEIVNYRDGKRVGDYSFKYNGKDVEMNIYAHFNDNKIDTLSFYSKDNKYGVIGGYIDKKNFLCNPWVQFVENTIHNEYFNKNIFIGEMSQDRTTGDKDCSLESISNLSVLLDKVLSEDGDFEIENEYYSVESIDYANHIYPDILTPEINYLPEKALIPVVFYHTTYSDSSLSRGEIPVDYYPIFKIQKDEEKTKKERYKRIMGDLKSDQEKIRVEDSIKEELSKREMKFNNTDFGRIIKQLKPYTSLSDDDFEQKKKECLNSTIQGCELGSIYKEQIGESGLYNIECHYNSLLKNQVYQNIEIPKELTNAEIVIIPTELGFKGTEWCVSKALVIYLTDDISSILKYSLKDGIYLDRTTGSNGIENICEGQIQIQKVSDNYIFNSRAHTPRGITNIVLIPMNTEEYIKGKCYYSFWTNEDKNIEEPLKKLTKSEVNKTIKERL